MQHAQEILSTSCLITIAHVQRKVESATDGGAHSCGLGDPDATEATKRPKRWRVNDALEMVRYACLEIIDI
jgi:hypothetical protein